MIASFKCKNQAKLKQTPIGAKKERTFKRNINSIKFNNSKNNSNKMNPNLNWKKWKWNCSNNCKILLLLLRH